MTLLATIVSVVIVTSLALTEVGNVLNILEALFTGVEKVNVLNRDSVKNTNWKNAYV